MAEFTPRNSFEWFDFLKAIFLGELVGTDIEGLTIDTTTDIGAELFALADALAKGDVQRSIIFWEAHPHLATRFGLQLRADELGITYDAGTGTEELRQLIILAERTNVGTRAWYEAVVPLAFPQDVTEVTVATSRRGPGSIEINLFRNGSPVADSVVEQVQAFFDGETARLTTDRVYISSFIPNSQVAND